MQITKTEDCLKILLTGEIDHHNAKQMREAIDAKVREERPEVLVLDFTNVEFMDSSGLGLIIGRYRLMQELSGRVEVVGANARIKSILKMAGAGKYVQIR